MSRDSLLWAIRHPEQNHDHYLFGTIHLTLSASPAIVACLCAFWKEHRVKVLLSEMCRLHQDIHSSGYDDRAPVAWKAQSTFDLTEHINPRQWRRWERYLKRRTDESLASYRRVPPMMAMARLSTLFAEQVRSKVLDTELSELAEEMGMPNYGVESVEEQLSVLSQLPMDGQIAMFKRFLSSLGRSIDKTQPLIELYLSQRVHQLYRQSRQQMGTLRRTVLIQRNQHMASRTDEYVKAVGADGVLFVTMGAAHLSGGTGMLHLLRSQGYRIQPLRIDWSKYGDG